MIQIIKLTDANVDVEEMIQVEGKQELTNGIIQRTKEAIEEYKRANDGKYDTDSIIQVACDHLEEEGYMCDYISTDAEIEF